MLGDKLLHKTDTFGTVLAQTPAHTLGTVYMSVVLAVQYYILFLMVYRNRCDGKLGLASNSTRLTILTVAGFLGVVGIILFMIYPISYWLLIPNIILALVTWAYVLKLRKQLNG